MARGATQATAHRATQESFTFAQAAEILNTDRAYLAQLLDGGALPTSGSGARCRIRREVSLPTGTRATPPAAP